MVNCFSKLQRKVLHTMRHLLLIVLFILASNAFGQTLRIYNWKDYIDPTVVQRFESETGIKVDYHSYTVAQEVYVALDGGGDFDLVVPSHFQLQRLINAGQLQALDSSKLENYHNLDPKLMASLAGFSGATRYVVPYLWTSVGLALDRPAAQRALGGEVPSSWRLLFDAEYFERLKDCGIGWLDAPEETFSIWMNLHGKRLADTSPRRLVNVGRQLLERTSAIRTLDNESYIEQLAAGQLCVAMAWAGHARQAASRRTSLEFIVPQEGGLLMIDSWAIPKNAQNPDLAYRFIDYMLQARNARLNSEATGFYVPLRNELPEIAEMAVNSPSLVPKVSERRHLYFLEPLKAEQKAMIDQQWSVVKQRFFAGQHPSTRTQ